MKKRSLLALCLLGWTFFSCESNPGEHKTIKDIIEEKSNLNSELSGDFAEHIPLKETHVVRDSIRDVEFLVLNREKSISRFPCSDCHSQSQDISKKENPHGDVVLNHGDNGKIENCQICHGEDNKKAALYSLEGDKISYNHVYELCGQCHYKAQRDWVGGSHGKRMSGWGEKRVQQNCTGCHNPHSPLMPKKWPAISPQKHEANHE